MLMRGSIDWFFEPAFLDAFAEEAFRQCPTAAAVTACLSNSSRELSGGAEDEDAVDALAEEEVDVRPQTGEVEGFVREHRRDDGGDDAVEDH